MDPHSARRRWHRSSGNKDGTHHDARQPRCAQRFYCTPNDCHDTDRPTCARGVRRTPPHFDDNSRCRLDRFTRSAVARRVRHPNGWTGRAARHRLESSATGHAWRRNADAGHRTQRGGKGGSLQPDRSTGASRAGTIHRYRTRRRSGCRGGAPLLRRARSLVPVLLWRLRSLWSRWLGLSALGMVRWRWEWMGMVTLDGTSL